MRSGSAWLSTFPLYWGATGAMTACSLMRFSGSLKQARLGVICLRIWVPGPQVYQRFARWSERGHFNTLFLALQEPDHEQLMVDSTSCKAHPASAGAQKKRDLKQLASLAVG